VVMRCSLLNGHVRRDLEVFAVYLSYIRGVLKVFAEVYMFAVVWTCLI
jgi:hypothetical protein